MNSSCCTAAVETRSQVAITLQSSKEYLSARATTLDLADPVHQVQINQDLKPIFPFLCFAVPRFQLWLHSRNLQTLSHACARLLSIRSFKRPCELPSIGRVKSVLFKVQSSCPSEPSPRCFDDSALAKIVETAYREFAEDPNAA